jgi:type IV pilus assembly protein PilN
MTRISLLDWRNERRARRQRQFTVLLLAGVTIGALIFGAAWFMIDSAIRNQDDRNDYLKQQIAEVDQKIKEIQELEKVKENLLSRMRVIEELQASRSATVHFFDEIVNTLPEGVNLTSIKQSGSSVQIDGVADSNGRVSAYMKNLDASPWFENPQLVVIKTADKGPLRKSSFTLRVKNLTKATKSDAKGSSGAEIDE